MRETTGADTSPMESELRALEKADLHVHLEGTINSQLLLKLCRQNDIDPNSPVRMPSGNQFTPARLDASRLSFADFSEFIGSFLKNSEALVHEDDIVLAAVHFAESCNAQNVKYCEINVSVMTLLALGWNSQKLFESLKHASSVVSREFGISFKWIFDIVRNASDNGEDTFKYALTARNMGVDVVAIGLSGDERLKGPEPFADTFAKARSENFNTLAHAGESSSSDLISRTVESLAPSRIGHGLSVINDADLTRKCIDQDIVFEVCPWSNILLGNASRETHPLTEMLQIGLKVIIGSDDPGLLDKDLSDNYSFVYQTGLGLPLLKEIAQTGVDISSNH